MLAATNWTEVGSLAAVGGVCLALAGACARGFGSWRDDRRGRQRAQEKLYGHYDGKDEEGKDVWIPGVIDIIPAMDRKLDQHISNHEIHRILW